MSAPPTCAPLHHSTTLPTAIADSGTNVNLIRPDIPLANERPSTLQAIAASKDGIQATSKGELTLGEDGLKLPAIGLLSMNH